MRRISHDTSHAKCRQVGHETSHENKTSGSPINIFSGFALLNNVNIIVFTNAANIISGETSHGSLMGVS